MPNNAQVTDGWPFTAKHLPPAQRAAAQVAAHGGLWRGYLASGKITGFISHGKSCQGRVIRLDSSRAFSEIPAGYLPGRSHTRVHFLGSTSHSMVRDISDNSGPWAPYLVIRSDNISAA